MKVLALVLCMMFVALSAMAGTTEDTNWTTPDAGINSLLNQYATHGHGYGMYEARNEFGIIGEVTLYKDSILGIPYSLGSQAQYDFNNSIWGFYSKVSIDLSGKVKSLLGIK